MSAVSVESESTSHRFAAFLGPYRALRGNPNLALLFGGQVVSALGDWLYITVISVLVFILTGSALAAALLSGVRLLPYALFLPIAGVLADRFDRRMLMITADLGRAVCMLGLLAACSHAIVWLAFPLVFAATCLGSLFRPALGATVPAIAATTDDLTQANALMSQIDGMAFVLGPSLAGVLILCGAAPMAFAINALSYLVSAGTLLRLRLPRVPHTAADAPAHWRDDVRSGVRFLFKARDGALGAITMSTAAMCGFLGASWTLFVALAIQTWHFGEQGSGFLLACFGIGGVVAGFLVGMLRGRARPVAVYTGSLAVSALAILVLGLSPAGMLPFLLLALFGGSDVVTTVIGNTIIQDATPNALLGRVFGAFEAIAVSATVFGALATGPLLAFAGPRGATIVLAVLAAAVVCRTLPRLRALDNPATNQPSSAAPTSQAHAGVAEYA